MIVFTTKPNNLSSDFVIKKVSPQNKVEMTKILILGIKTMPKHMEALNDFISNETYTTVFACYDKRTNQPVGACLMYDRRRLDLIAEVKNPMRAGKNLYLDFLYVDPNYQHQHIASNMLNEIYKYAEKQGFENLELMCEISESLKDNLYDKNGFSRTEINGQYNIPFFFTFVAPVNKEILKFGNVVYATMIDALNSGVNSYGQYKEALKNGYVPKMITKLSDGAVPIFKQTVQSSRFDMFDDALKTIFDEERSLTEVNAVLESYKTLKYRDIVLMPAMVKGAFLDGTSTVLANYALNKQQYNNLPFVNRVLETTENKFVNDLIIDRFTK